MLSVTIPWDLTSARANMDFMEMELTAQVTVCNISCYLISPYFSEVTLKEKQIKKYKQTNINKTQEKTKKQVSFK